jgi:hypothetical protein
MTVSFVRRVGFAALALAIAGCGNSSDSTSGSLSSSSTGGTTGGTTGGNPNAPKITRTIPSNGSTGMPTDGILIVTFSTAMNQSTLAPNITLADGTGATVTGSLNYYPSLLSASIQPSAALTPNSLYAVLLGSGVTDANGNALASTGFTFTSGAGPATGLPSFGGLTGANYDAQGNVTLKWTAATDPSYPTNELYYAIYTGANAASVDFSTIQALVPFGSTSFLAQTQLAPGATMAFGVRAWDLSSKSDTNKIVYTINIPAQQQRSAPSFGGLSSATAVSTSEIDLAWSAGSDTVDPASSLTYRIYMATSSGGENYNSASFTTAAGATTYKVTGLSASKAYYFVVRAVNTVNLADTNTTQKSATTQAAAPVVHFSTDIESGIFQSNGCMGCHGGTQNLYLNTYSGVIKGGSSGPGIVPGNPNSSYVYGQLSAPGNPGSNPGSNQSQHQISAAQKTNLKNWILAGAPNN